MIKNIIGIFSALYLIAAIEGQDNELFPEFSLSLLVDVPSVARIGNTPRSYSEVSSGKLSNFSSLESLAFIGFNFNYYPMPQLGLNFSYITGRLHVFFENEAQCISVTGSNRCDVADKESLIFGDIHNILIGPSYRFQIFNNDHSFLPHYVSISGGYFLYAISYEKQLTGGILGLQTNDITDSMNHGAYLNFEFDFYLKNSDGQIIGLPTGFLSIGVGLRYILVNLPGTSTNLHEWIYSLPVKFGVAF